MSRSFLLSAILCAACASKPVRPDDQSAQAHREEAARERAEADAHQKQYDPNATAAHTQTRAAAAGVADVELFSYNPTEWHKQEANRLSAHARAHEAAAGELEKFEAAECRDFQPKVRAACPVAGPIARVEDLPNGVRFVLVENAPARAVVAHMRCHFAWARSRGFENTTGCPTYVKGIDIRLSGDGKSIEITGADRALVMELKKRSHDEKGAGSQSI